MIRLAARQTEAMRLSPAFACRDNLLKGPSVARKRCLELRHLLPTTYGGINEPRLDLQGVCDPAHFLGGQDGGAGAGELIEHRLALGSGCGFRGNAATDSDGKRPPNPIESGHLIRTKAATLLTG